MFFKWVYILRGVFLGFRSPYSKHSHYLSILLIKVTCGIEITKVVYVWLNYSILLILGILFLSFTGFFVTGSSSLIDLNARVEINDAWLNLLYFFWTSATYLPIFFFSLGGLMLISYSSYSYLFIFFWLVVSFVIYCIEGGDSISLNVNLFTIDLTHMEINLLLTNSLNKYHPGLFFISVLWLFLLSNFQLTNILVQYQFIRNLTLYNALPYWFWLSLFNIIALFLGSWWAFQEGTWGGWWNWDASEVLGLLISVFGLYSFHRRKTLLTVQAEFAQLNLCLCIFLFSYFFTQLNFELISHNFTPVFLLFFTKNTFFVEMEGILIFFIWIQLVRYYQTESSLITLVTWGFILKSRAEGRWLQVLGIWGVITGALLISFGPLINHFMWTYLSLNSLGFFIHLTSYLFIFLISLVLNFLNSGGVWLLSLVSLGFWNWYSALVLLPFFLIPQRQLVSALHIIVTLFITANLLSHALPFVEWLPWLRVGEISYCGRVLLLQQSSYTCYNELIEVVDFYSWHYETTHPMWNAWYHSNSLSLHAFSLLLSPVGGSNFYNVSWGWWSLFLLIETTLVNNLVDLFIGGLVGIFLLRPTSRSLCYSV